MVSTRQHQCLTQPVTEIEDTTLGIRSRRTYLHVGLPCLEEAAKPQLQQVMSNLLTTPMPMPLVKTISLRPKGSTLLVSGLSHLLTNIMNKSRKESRRKFSTNSSKYAELKSEIGTSEEKPFGLSSSLHTMGGPVAMESREVPAGALTMWSPPPNSHITDKVAASSGGAVAHPAYVRELHCRWRVCVPLCPSGGCRAAKGLRGGLRTASTQ